MSSGNSCFSFLCLGSQSLCQRESLYERINHTMFSQSVHERSDTLNTASFCSCSSGLGSHIPAQQQYNHSHQATEPASFITNSQDNNRTLRQRAPHRVFERCQMCLLRGSPPSAACLKWISLLQLAKCAWCMHRHLKSQVFLGAC